MGADIFYKELQVAGQRLLDAQEAEESLSVLYRRERSPEARTKWLHARAAVDAHARNYQEAVRCHRDRA
jgi:hypothetical protein